MKKPKNIVNVAQTQVNTDFDKIEDEMTESHLPTKVVYGIGFLMVLLGIGTLFYSNVEKWTLIDALYFSSYTITTVGYGNLYPTTDFSKLFTIVYMFIGVGAGFYIITNIAAEILKRREMEWLEQQRRGRLRHIKVIGQHLTKAAGKFAYDKNEIHKYNEENKK